MRCLSPSRGKPRTQAAIKVAIEKTVLRHLGVKITPHQFRHLAAKIDSRRQSRRVRIGAAAVGPQKPEDDHNFYAGVDTRRAGRAHAELIMKLRESKFGRGRSRRTPRPREE